MTRVKLQTSKGDINVELFAKEAPGTVANFVKLSKDGYELPSANFTNTDIACTRYVIRHLQIHLRRPKHSGGHPLAFPSKKGMTRPHGRIRRQASILRLVDERISTCAKNTP